jgi:squalene-hopene/tetraprenyl-beta-curcumene cyclase
MTKSSMLTLALVFSLTLLAQSQSVPPDVLRQAQASAEKGLAWLKAQQKPSGAWSEENMPALTALPLWAIAASGLPGFGPEQDKAVACLLGKQRPDGGIYVPQPDKKGSGLGNYNTSISVMALQATGRREAIPAILKARAYIASSQHFGDDTHEGGFGYDKDSQRAYTDLNNTQYSMDAMRRTQSAEDLRPSGEKKADINWDAALKYVGQMQNKEGETAGGFAYNTEDPKGGAVTNASGRMMLRAYGSMTYAGLLAMVHAKLEKSDPRVRSAVDYSSRFWTLEENPGQGQQGVYFYYNIMARSLSAAGLEAIPKQNAAEQIRWREEVVKKIIALQKPDGSWVNANNRWWENDPVLASSYALLALEFASGLTR